MKPVQVIGWFLLFAGAFVLCLYMMMVRAVHAAPPTKAEPSCNCAKKVVAKAKAVIAKARRVLRKAKAARALAKQKCKTAKDKAKVKCDTKLTTAGIEKQKCRRQLKACAKSLKAPPVLPWVIVGIALTVAAGFGIWAGVERHRADQLEKAKP